MRYILSLLLLLAFSLSALSQQPIPNDNKKCRCPEKLKSCKKFAKSKEAKKACDEAYKECLQNCDEQG